MDANFYLFFNGNCLEAMTSYADILGGEITGVFRNGDMEDPENRMRGPDSLVMNMAMKLGNRTLMASDSVGEHYAKPQGFYVQLEIDTKAETKRLYAALSKDAQNIPMPLGETFWAERFAMFTDRYGTPWMLNFTGNKKMGETG